MIRASHITTMAVLLAGPIFGQSLPPEDWFNRAAKEYVKQDKTLALRTLDRALQEHPGDPRLLRLAEELLKEQDQQQQQPQPQQSQDQQQDKQDQQNDGGQQQQKQEQRNDKPEGGRISPQDAKRILDALDRQERDTQDKVRERQRPVPRTPADKDW
ncbi:MAG: hypothetical protein KIT10_01695 [Flavobacteriales bacterium]|nr:hypothetical protein [Flavobacteriales bacterium]